MMKGVFVTATDTDAGKTVASAIIATALQAAYWKPIQSGDLDHSDSMKIEAMTSGIDILPERHRLTVPASPHYSAEVDGVELSLSDFELPKHDRPILVEGAGGLLVPFNEHELMIDLIDQLSLPTILVSRHKLGSINHTLLSLDALHLRGIHLAGIVFVGAETPSTETIIAAHGHTPIIGRIPWADDLNSNFIQAEAARLKPALLDALGLT